MPSPGDSAPPQMAVVVEGQPKRSFAIDPSRSCTLSFRCRLSNRGFYALLRVANRLRSLVKNAVRSEPMRFSDTACRKLQSYLVNRPKTVYETYLAPDLNFVPLLRLANNGERVTYRQIAISVDTKEPDDTVFAIPDDYRKVSEMSEFYGAGELARGR